LEPFAKFSKENRKRKEKRKGKRVKGCGGNVSAWDQKKPTAQLLYFLNRYRPPLSR
jgi:hypothetical protein